MGNSGVRKIGKGFVAFTAFLNGIATFWTFMIMFLMTGDVLGRVLFNAPITGTPELVRISIVGIIFMHIPHTLWVNRHIRSDIILSRLKPRTKSIFEIFMFLVGAAVFLGIVTSSWGRMITSWQILEYEGEGALRVPVYPIRSLVILGSALTAVIFLYRIVERVLAVVKGKGTN